MITAVERRNTPISNVIKENPAEICSFLSLFIILFMFVNNCISTIEYTAGFFLVNFGEGRVVIYDFPARGQR